MLQRALKAAAAICAAVLLLSGSPSVLGRSSASAVTYTFDDEFSGTTLSAKWLHHIHCCGTLVGYDTRLTTVANGYLSMRVDKRSNGWYGDLIDTKTTFNQKYGYFEARIKIPKGTGLWPSWWLYNPAYAGEIDQMEICANPLGTNGGNDAHELHTTVHWSGGATTTGRYYTVDLSQAFHVYAVDWRSTAIKFYLDGTLVWTWTTHIPTNPLPLLLNLGIGGTWCGAPNSSTPDGATMLVDWVRVRA
jgi:beta-glucanase (GH16 family)